MTDKPDQEDLKPETTLDAEKGDVRTADERQDQEQQQNIAAVEQSDRVEEMDREDRAPVAETAPMAAPAPAATTTVDESPAVAEESHQTDVEPAHDNEFWPEYNDYRQRFDAVQAEFIEEPRAAVQKAETLMGEVVERMIDALHNRMQSIHNDVSGDGEVDTERLRLVMRSYRELIDAMGGHRAA